MRTETIERNTPISTKKSAFFKALVAFFDSYANVPTDTLNDKQCEIINVINNFDENGTYIPHYSLHNISVLSADVIKRMTPCHKRKRAIFRALVNFMDATLAHHKEIEEENGYTADDNETFVAIVARFMPDDIGVTIIDTNIKADYEEHRQQTKSNAKKRYVVNVHYWAVASVEVDAESEDEAKRIAMQNASDYEWDDYDVDYCNVVDIVED